ncbi:hypothetical protein, partial [Candidatus Similichlamydia epinepheli]|uniref:hypothetical protein n=1 Tax=Candidatus Similichlamydia epinepheli TaxID=1903953 RepID=UPI001300297D
MSLSVSHVSGQSTVGQYQIPILSYDSFIQKIRDFSRVKFHEEVGTGGRSCCVRRELFYNAGIDLKGEGFRDPKLNVSLDTRPERGPFQSGELFIVSDPPGGGIYLCFIPDPHAKKRDTKTKWGKDVRGECADLAKKEPQFCLSGCVISILSCRKAFIQDGNLHGVKITILSRNSIAPIIFCERLAEDVSSIERPLSPVGIGPNENFVRVSFVTNECGFEFESFVPFLTEDELKAKISDFNLSDIRDQPKRRTVYEYIFQDGSPGHIISFPFGLRRSVFSGNSEGGTFCLSYREDADQSKNLLQIIFIAPELSTKKLGATSQKVHTFQKWQIGDQPLKQSRPTSPIFRYFAHGVTFVKVSENEVRVQGLKLKLLTSIKGFGGLLVTKEQADATQSTSRTTTDDSGEGTSGQHAEGSEPGTSTKSVGEASSRKRKSSGAPESDSPIPKRGAQKFLKYAMSSEFFTQGIEERPEDMDVTGSESAMSHEEASLRTSPIVEVEEAEEVASEIVVPSQADVAVQTSLIVEVEDVVEEAAEVVTPSQADVAVQTSPIDEVEEAEEVASEIVVPSQADVAVQTSPIDEVEEAEEVASEIVVSSQEEVESQASPIIEFEDVEEGTSELALIRQEEVALQASMIEDAGEGTSSSTMLSPMRLSSSYDQVVVEDLFLSIPYIIDVERHQEYRVRILNFNQFIHRVQDFYDSRISKKSTNRRIGRSSCVIRDVPSDEANVRHELFLIPKAKFSDKYCSTPLLHGELILVTNPPEGGVYVCFIPDINSQGHFKDIELKKFTKLTKLYPTFFADSEIFYFTSRYISVLRVRRACLDLSSFNFTGIKLSILSAKNVLPIVACEISGVNLLPFERTLNPVGAISCKKFTRVKFFTSEPGFLGESYIPVLNEEELQFEVVTQLGSTYTMYRAYRENAVSKILDSVFKGELISFPLGVWHDLLSGKVKGGSVCLSYIEGSEQCSSGVQITFLAPELCVNNIPPVARGLHIFNKRHTDGYEPLKSSRPMSPIFHYFVEGVNLSKASQNEMQLEGLKLEFLTSVKGFSGLLVSRVDCTSISGQSTTEAVDLSQEEEELILAAFSSEQGLQISSEEGIADHDYACASTSMLQESVELQVEEIEPTSSAPSQFQEEELILAALSSQQGLQISSGEVIVDHDYARASTSMLQESVELQMEEIEPISSTPSPFHEELTIAALSSLQESVELQVEEFEPTSSTPSPFHEELTIAAFSSEQGLQISSEEGLADGECASTSMLHECAELQAEEIESASSTPSQFQPEE